MALSKLDANSFDLTDNYALTGTVTGATSTQKLFLIKNIDASSSSTVDFVNGASSVVLDNTYKTYLFKFINVHSASDNINFTFNGRDGGSSYDATKTTTSFQSTHNEAGNDAGATYQESFDLQQSTAFQPLFFGLGNGNDESVSGELFLFNPSSTTFVKHFVCRTVGYVYEDYVKDFFAAGYFNVTAAIDAIQFKMSSGNIDSGRIALYGIK
tara:strand:- start:781 stop:1416 length:636 start_codon:yes stop_codon:yes gene_type:complete